MSGKVDWKSKYMELRSKYMNAIDVSFRLGYEEGMRDAEMEAMQAEAERQQAEAEAAEMEAMEGEMPVEGMEEGMEGEVPVEEGAGEEADLDSSINELEGYVKSEGKSVDVASIMKDLHKSESKKTPTKKTKATEKIDSILKKWDEEDSSEDTTETGEILGQA